MDAAGGVEAPDEAAAWVLERRRREAEMRTQFVGRQGLGGGGAGGAGWDAAELEEFLGGGGLPAGAEARLRAAVAARVADREARAARAAAAREAARAAEAALELREAWAVRRELARAVGAPPAVGDVAAVDEAAEAAADVAARAALEALRRGQALLAEAAAACGRARGAAAAGVSGAAQAAAWRALASAARTEAAAAAAAALHTARELAALPTAPAAALPADEPAAVVPTADEAAAAAELASYHRSLLEEQASAMRILLGVAPGYAPPGQQRGWQRPDVAHAAPPAELPAAPRAARPEPVNNDVAAARQLIAELRARMERRRGLVPNAAAAAAAAEPEEPPGPPPVPASDAELMDACAMVEQRRENFCAAAVVASTMAKARLAAAAAAAAPEARGRKRAETGAVQDEDEVVPPSPKLPRAALVAAA